MKSKKWTGKNIKRIRESLTLTQAQLAQYLGYKHSNRIQEFESGKHNLPQAQSTLMDVLESSVTNQAFDLKLTEITTIRVSAISQHK